MDAVPIERSQSMKRMMTSVKVLTIAAVALVMLPGCCATCLIGPLLALLGLTALPAAGQ